MYGYYFFFLFCNYFFSLEEVNFPYFFSLSIDLLFSNFHNESSNVQHE